MGYCSIALGCCLMCCTQWLVLCSLSLWSWFSPPILTPLWRYPIGHEFKIPRHFMFSVSFPLESVRE